MFRGPVLGSENKRFFQTTKHIWPVHTMFVISAKTRAVPWYPRKNKDFDIHTYLNVVLEQNKKE